MSDDWMLAQGTVDFRNEERRHWNGWSDVPLADGQDWVALGIEEAWLAESQAQDAICTRDEDCRAQADAHESDCPVEKRLLEEMGF